MQPNLLHTVITCDMQCTRMMCHMHVRYMYLTCMLQYDLHTEDMHVDLHACQA